MSRTMRGANRCVECGRFTAWDELIMSLFIPDSEFGPEYAEFTCRDCWAYMHDYDRNPELNKGELLTGISWDH